MILIFRRERNNCRICWTQVANTDFALTGGNFNGANFNPVKSVRNVSAKPYVAYLVNVSAPSC